MSKFEQLAAMMRKEIERVERESTSEASSGKVSEASPAKAEKRPVSGADAMARWQRENEEGGADRVRKLREKHED